MIKNKEFILLKEEIANNQVFNVELKLNINDHKAIGLYLNFYLKDGKSIDLLSYLSIYIYSKIKISDFIFYDFQKFILKNKFKIIKLKSNSRELVEFVEKVLTKEFSRSINREFDMLKEEADKKEASILKLKQDKLAKLKLKIKSDKEKEIVC